MELDKRVIQLRVDVIERNLKELKEILKLKEISYRDELALKHALLESIEACVDIANHIIAVKGLRRPTDYRDVFRVLVENNIVSKRFGERLEEMASFRNVLVHRYAYVDTKKLMEIAKRDVKDVEKFVKIVLSLISKNRKTFERVI